MIRKEREKVMYRHPLYLFMLADVDYLHQMELTMAEDRTFDTVCGKSGGFKIEQMFGNFLYSLHNTFSLCYNFRVKDIQAIRLFCML